MNDSPAPSSSAASGEEAPDRSLRLQLLNEAPDAWPLPPAPVEQAIVRAIKAAWQVARAHDGVPLRIADLAAGPGLEVEVVLADDATMQELNRHWRGKDAPTNVLSFPTPPDAPLPLGERWPLGSILLGGGVLAREAHARGVPLAEHAAWMAIHGLLHLLGHDHQHEEEAARMQALERAALRRLGLADPYAEPDEER